MGANNCCSAACMSGKAQLDYKDKMREDKEMKELIDHARKNEDKIVKIQAAFKGSRARK
jgi:hypothetical protein